MGALFSNIRMREQLIPALEKMGHKQPPMPICTGNSTVKGIVDSKLKQCWSHTIDMRFYWVRDRCQQGHFIIYWRP
eukprot:112570-Ditylum_brightwellii.AAC.2